MTSFRYNAPGGEVRRRFVGALNDELSGVQDRRWDLEWFIVFQTVILQQAQHVTVYHEIRRWIEKGLNAWEAGYHRILMEKTLMICTQ